MCPPLDELQLFADAVGRVLGRDKKGQKGQKGTGQIREKVKGDENEIGIAGGRSLSLKAREGAGVANK